MEKEAEFGPRNYGSEEGDKKMRGLLTVPT